VPFADGDLTPSEPFIEAADIAVRRREEDRTRCGGGSRGGGDVGELHARRKLAGGEPYALSTSFAVSGSLCTGRMKGVVRGEECCRGGGGGDPRCGLHTRA